MSQHFMPRCRLGPFTVKAVARLGLGKRLQSVLKGRSLEAASQRLRSVDLDRQLHYFTASTTSRSCRRLARRHAADRSSRFC